MIINKDYFESKNRKFKNDKRVSSSRKAGKSHDVPSGFAEILAVELEKQQRENK